VSFAGHLRLDLLRGSQMLKHDRQGVGGEVLELDVLARADFMLEKLRGLLMFRSGPGIRTMGLVGGGIVPSC
jgi:hypothetical protein